LIGSVGPFRTNKEDLKRNLHKRRFEHTHRIHELQLYHYFRKIEVQSTIFKNQSYNITMLNSISVYIYHLQGSLFKEKQSLQPKSGDNIKYFHKYYNWLMYRFSRERFHPHDTKCMSDEMYRGLQ
jgi:hypothetical protein